MFDKVNNSLKFINHNKKKFSQNWNNSEKIILVEFFEYKPSMIPYSYISNVLAKKYNAKIIAYKTKFHNYNDFIKRFFKLPLVNNFNIFKSFNVNFLIVPCIFGKNKTN